LVVVLAPAIEDEMMRNALSRISGELAAAPFMTITERIDPSRDVMPQVETAGSDRAATAAFAIVRDHRAGSAQVTIWVSNRVTQTTTMQRMQIEDGDVDRAAARLAVEAVELVRASLAGLWPEAPRELESETPERPALPRSTRLALAVSVGMLRDLGDAPPFWAPHIAAAYGASASIAVRLAASGLGPGASVSASGGTAHMQRAMLTIGLVRWFRPDRMVQPMLGLAAGVHHLSAHGVSASLPAHDRSAFAALAAASAGLAIALGPRLAVTAETDALFLWPAVTVRIDTTDAATFNRPSLFIRVGLRATF
jgi:hypothetical protein